MRLQDFELGSCQFEEKVGREALAVASHLFVQATGLDAVERGEIVVEKDLVAAYDQDALMYRVQS